MADASAHYPGQAQIEAYGNGGFRFAGMSHRGSILCLPSGIYAWDVESVAELDVSRFAPVFAEKGALLFTLLGTGAAQQIPRPEVLKAFATAGIGLEFMNTGAACRTYNVLLSEGRPVSAALIAVS